MATIRFLGTALDTLSYWIDGMAGWADVPSRALTTVAVPGRLGAVVTRAQEGARDLEVRGILSPVSAVHADRQRAEDQLRALAASGLVTVVVEDPWSGIERATDGICVGVTVAPVARARPIRAYGLEVTVRLVCPDATWRDVAWQIVGVGAAPTPMPMGSAPVAPLVRILGSATNPLLRLRRPGGPTISQSTFTITLGASDWLEIDCATYRIEQVVSGTRSAAYAVYSGDPLPVLLPPHGLWSVESWPTLEVTSGTALVTYERRWR